jgi:cysteine desulfurase/selenocysteine lyase
MKDGNGTLIAPFDVDRMRADFAVLASVKGGERLVYLDTAASAQKPRMVIEAERRAYEIECANIYRGHYQLALWSTERFDAARCTVQRFINARHSHEIVFTRNATEAINLVAASYGRAFLQPGDEVVLSELEHHSNIVPWQMLRDERGIVLKVAPIDGRGGLPVASVARLLGPRTKLVALTQVSNVLGTVTHVSEVIRRARAVGAKVLVDGAQAVMHMPVDMQALDCDFYVFSGHKIYGPTGIGVLYAKEEILEAMPPYQGGGNMAASVSFEQSSWGALPQKFEAGTPPLAQAAGLAAAINYVQAIGLERIAKHEQDLLAYATLRLAALPGVSIQGALPEKAPIISFTLDCAPAHDVTRVLDVMGVAVRAGTHDAQPLMARLGLAETVRASFGLYNSREDVDRFIEALDQAQAMFRR